MANVFKVKTNGSLPAAAGTPDTLYTVPASKTAVVLGLVLCNNGTSAIDVDVKLVSDTSDDETNETVFVVKDAPLPVGGSLEVLSGGKVVLQATDELQIDSNTSGQVDATLSIMESDVS